MSFTLISLDEDGREVTMNNTAWPKMLSLARGHGWEPAGCLPADHQRLHDQGQFNPEDIRWIDAPGARRDPYDHNGFQQITAGDAANMADALEKSLDDIPDHQATALGLYPAPGDKIAGILRETLGGGEVLVPGPDPAKGHLEYFSGEMKPLVRDMIALCRAGRFMVY